MTWDRGLTQKALNALPLTHYPTLVCLLIMSTPSAQIQSQFAATIGSWIIGATASTGCLEAARTSALRDPRTLSVGNSSTDADSEVASSVVNFGEITRRLCRLAVAECNDRRFRVLDCFLNGTFAGVVTGLPSRIAAVALGSAIIVDWTITICLVSFLRRNQNSRAMQALKLGLSRFLSFDIRQAVNFQSINLYQISIFELVGNFSPVYANTVIASLNSRTLATEHLNRPGNLHFSTMNVSTQVDGFRRPSFTMSQDGIYRAPVISPGEASHTNQTVTGMSSSRDANCEISRSTENADQSGGSIAKRTDAMVV
ncbi:hypothetical protein NP233_g5039 [Leucocoprinus birnbaumii]|uniref:Uncharacterized protein n=1 Tax=Leucocoprinus birnbaumii TaxID=56174 RepID=A0AAD5VVX0_9AGAR|nr:hypothetical protein NP233_g5039 [Leucocoprinus birnbaumii]